MPGAALFLGCRVYFSPVMTSLPPSTISSSSSLNVGNSRLNASSSTQVASTAAWPSQRMSSS
jgi:hypothetical protein